MHKRAFIVALLILLVLPTVAEAAKQAPTRLLASVEAMPVSHRDQEAKVAIDLGQVPEVEVFSGVRPGEGGFVDTIIYIPDLPSSPVTARVGREDGDGPVLSAMPSVTRVELPATSPAVRSLIDGSEHEEWIIIPLGLVTEPGEVTVHVRIPGPAGSDLTFVADILVEVQALDFFVDVCRRGKMIDVTFYLFFIEEEVPSLVEVVVGDWSAVLSVERREPGFGVVEVFNVPRQSYEAVLDGGGFEVFTSVEGVIYDTFWPRWQEIYTCGGGKG